MAQYVDQEGNQLWTIDEAAREWGVSPRRVYKWIKGRDGESKGLYRNRDGGVMRRFSKERKRLPEGSYALYPVGRRSIYLIRPQPYPEPILAAFERPFSASHPEDRTSEISYEANSMEAKKYGYPDGSISTPPFIDPYAAAEAMYAPKIEKEEVDEPRQTRRKRQAVSDVEARGKRPLATPEEIAAAEQAKAEKAAKKAERASQRASKVPPGFKPVEQIPEENLPTPPFYKIEIFDQTNPRENIIRFGKFENDEQARVYALGQVSVNVPQYLVLAYSHTGRWDDVSPLNFYATPTAERNPKKFPQQVKSLLTQYNFVVQRGAVPVYPAPEVIGEAAPPPTAPPTPVQPSEEPDETVPEVAVRKPRPPPIIERKVTLAPPVQAPVQAPVAPAPAAPPPATAAPKTVDPAKKNLAIKTAKTLVDKEIKDRRERLEQELDREQAGEAAQRAADQIALLKSGDVKQAIRAEVEQKIESGQIDSADPKLMKLLFSAAQAAVTNALKRP